MKISELYSVGSGQFSVVGSLQNIATAEPVEAKAGLYVESPLGIFREEWIL